MVESQPTYEFGPFRANAHTKRLWRDGEPVPLAPKVLETLLVLIAFRDRVVSKDELLERVWDGAAVEEGGLTRNISVLRKTLGETPDEHTYIVTVPGNGYRFVAEVRQSEGPGSPASEPVLERQAAPGRRRALAPAWLVFVGCAALFVGLLVYWLRAAPSIEAGRPSIAALAVLPLDNLSGDPSQEYFADGMTEALIGNLARISALRVVSRTSVMRFKGAKRPISEISQALHVDAILEGSVRRTGDRVRISVQLIHAATDAHVWSREYEGDLSDILKLQGEVARAAAAEIRVQITAEERARLTAAGAVNPEAYQQYLLGQHYLWKMTAEDLTRAIEHFERATALDAGYAAAHAGLSHAWWWRGVWGDMTPKQVEPPSRAEALRALALDPQLAEAHVSTGRIKFSYDWDWTGAEKDFARALAIDPNNLDSHFFHGMLYMALGRFPEALVHIERAEQLDSLSATVQSGFGRILYRARRFEEALTHLKQAIDLEPMTPGNYHRVADVYEEMGRYDEALAFQEKENKVLGRASAAGPDLARIYARMGNRQKARQILALGEASRRTWLSMASAYAALGEHDEAFRLLFKSVDERDGPNYVRTDPRLDTLHSDPRWRVLLERMHLSD